MNTETAEIKILPASKRTELKTAFAKLWLERFESATPQGKKIRAAAVVGLTSGAISVWAKPQIKKGEIYITLPDAWQSDLVAQELGVSPSWLTFGAGPASPALASLGQAIAKKLDEDPALAHVVAAWLDAPAEEKKFIKAWAEKYPAPLVPTLIKKISEPTMTQVIVDHELKLFAITPAGVGELAAPPRKSATKPLSRVEAEALLKWFGTNLKTMPLERPLTRALLKISMMLTGGTVPAELPPDLVRGATTQEPLETVAPKAKIVQRPRRRPS